LPDATDRSGFGKTFSIWHDLSFWGGEADTKQVAEIRRRRVDDDARESCGCWVLME